LAIHVTIIDALGAIFEVDEIPAPDIRNTVNNMTPIEVDIVLDGDTLILSLNEVERIRATVNLDAYFAVATSLWGLPAERVRPPTGKTF
jgi:hypothetical protein